jgi:hypothetical protein
MTNLAVGDRVLLRYAPYGSSGVVTALSHGKAQVRWGDLELTTKHSPESLVISVEECEKVTSMKALKGTSMVALIVALFFTPYMAVAQCYTIGCRSFNQSSVGASWSLLQSPAQECAAGATCAMTITSTTASSVGTAAAYLSDSNSISSVSLSGCTGSAGTWTGGTGASYAAFNSSGAEGIAWAYNLGNGGGCTLVTITMTAAETSTWTIVYDEFSRGGGTPAIDALASSNTNSSSCTTCTGSSFTSLSGSSDLLLQVVADGSSTGSPSSPYLWDSNELTAYALNSTQTTAPTWTQSGGPFVTLGAAFK